MRACRRAILVLTGVLLLGACDSQFDAQAELGNTIVASIASGSPEYLRRFPPAAAATLAEARNDFRGEFRQVLLDETWGVIELGYCFESGAFVYLTLPASEGHIEVFDIHPAVAGSSRAARCKKTGE
jgi:hypothetical protein